MSTKGNQRITYNEPKRRDRDMYEFLAYIYPNVKKYQYAKQRFVDGESILDIYEKERIRRDIKENSIRKYTEDVRKEIIKRDNKNGIIKYSALRIKGNADKSKILKIFLDIYADTGYLISKTLDWDDKLVRQVLSEKYGKSIYIKYGESIFGIKGLQVSKSVCQNIISDYIEEQKRKLPSGMRLFYTRFERFSENEKQNDFNGRNLCFAKYMVILQTVGKEYAFEINLPVYLDSYGSVNKFKKNLYNPVTYPLTCIKLPNPDSEESVYYEKQWKKLFREIVAKLKRTTKVGRCKISEITEKMQVYNCNADVSQNKYLYIKIGTDLILVLDDTIRNAKLIKEYGKYFEN